MNDEEEDRILASGMLLSVFRNASKGCPVPDYYKYLKDTAAYLVERGWDAEGYVDTMLRDAWELYPLQVLAVCDDWRKADLGDKRTMEGVIHHAARSALLSDLRSRMKKRRT